MLKIKILEEKHQYINQSLTTANERLDSLKHSIIEIKRVTFIRKLSDELVVESISTIGQIKAHDKYIIDLNQQRNNLLKDINHFYERAQSVTEPHLKLFNQMSFFHDVKQWLKMQKNKMRLGIKIKLKRNYSIMN